LNTENTNYRQFVSGFVWDRYQNQGWQWVNGLNRTDWTLEQNSQLLTYLPFDGDTWRRANKWLSASASMYWQKVLVNPYQSANDLLFAIDKLLEAARPQAAIDCLICQLCKKIRLIVSELFELSWLRYLPQKPQQLWTPITLRSLSRHCRMIRKLIQMIYSRLNGPTYHYWIG